MQRLARTIAAAVCWRHPPARKSVSTICWSRSVSSRTAGTGCRHHQGRPHHRGRCCRTRVLGQEIPVTVDDRFHIGSDTKAMTATLAGILIDKGQLSWTSTIGDVLGPVIPASSRSSRRSHSSSFCRIPAACPPTMTRSPPSTTAPTHTR